MVRVTEIAAEKIKIFLNKRGSGVGIRVGTRKSGCSGLAYVLEYVDEVKATYAQFDDNGVSVFIDNTDLPILEDLVIDYKKQGLNEGFDFSNSRELGRCGCNESFRV